MSSHLPVLHCRCKWLKPCNMHTVFTCYGQSENYGKTSGALKIWKWELIKGASKLTLSQMKSDQEYRCNDENKTCGFSAQMSAFSFCLMGGSKCHSTLSSSYKWGAKGLFSIQTVPALLLGIKTLLIWYQLSWCKANWLPQRIQKPTLCSYHCMIRYKNANWWGGYLRRGGALFIRQAFRDVGFRLDLWGSV